MKVTEAISLIKAGLEKTKYSDIEVLVLPALRGRILIETYGRLNGEKYGDSIRPKVEHLRGEGYIVQSDVMLVHSIIKNWQIESPYVRN